MALVKLFARVLRRDADGRYFLVTPAEKIDIAVEDAPFAAVELERHGERARTKAFCSVRMWTTSCAAGRSIRCVWNGRRRRRSQARVSMFADGLKRWWREVWFTISSISPVEDDDGRGGIWSDGAFFRCPGMAGAREA